MKDPNTYDRDGGDISIMRIVRAWGLTYPLGKVLEYLSTHRTREMDEYLEDMKKARAALDEEIRYWEARQA